MKTIIAACTLIPALLLTACGNDETGKQPADDLSDFTVAASQAESAKGDFIYRLATEKEQYTEGEKVEIYAELEYTGKQESIEISHAASPFYFPLHEETRNYAVEYAMNEPLLTTRLIQGEPLQESYSGSGGYSEAEDVAYVEFVQRIMEQDFPAGYYKVNGYADFIVEAANGSAAPYEIHAQIDFKVIPEI
ncbi:hypothetical protein [Planococcus sp. 4-30]|uniref:hypothetical protein n=1 Tax=Planococcus sp. 4-30 TaxID=2874583 RepID=UPI001CC008FF|nr:hypothetical protein [Planococcus sp. 4-30]